jgi:hypothetical protein
MAELDGRKNADGTADLFGAMELDGATFTSKQSSTRKGALCNHYDTFASADGGCGGTRSVKKTDTVVVTAATATAKTKLISIRVAWGTWAQVYVSNPCTYTVTESQHSAASTVLATAAAGLLPMLVSLFAMTTRR